jgi:hypothetical protein
MSSLLDERALASFLLLDAGQKRRADLHATNEQNRKFRLTRQILSKTKFDD